MVYHNWSIFVLKLILYSVKFEERKMDHKKSFTNHQYINKISCTCSSSLFSVSFIMVQYFFNEGYPEEIERDKIRCNNTSYSIEDNNIKPTLPIYSAMLVQSLVVLLFHYYLLFKKGVILSIGSETLYQMCLVMLKLAQW